MPDVPGDTEQAPAGTGSKRAHAAPVAALALAVGKTVKAARDAGVGERTVYTWLKKPAFRRRVDELRRSLASEAVGKLSRSMSAAAGVLHDLLRSPDEGTRLKASRAILELATRLRESEELQRRVADLEQRVERARATR